MKLTQREKSVAERYAEGKSYREVARDLGIAPPTVRNHLATVYGKLGVSNKLELARVLSSGQGDLGALPPIDPEAATTPILAATERSKALSAVGASLAVLPFQVNGPAKLRYFGRGLSLDVQHLLTSSREVLISGRSSCLAIDDDRPDPRTAATALGVRYLLRGSLRLEAGRITLHVELLDGGGGAILWSERYDDQLDEVLNLQAEIAEAVASALSIKIASNQRLRRANIGRDELTAYDERLRGNYFLERGGPQNIESAKACFLRALELEKGSAPALAGLSMCFGYQCDLLLTGEYDRCLARHAELAFEAVEADPTDSRGHYAACCALMLGGDFERADHHARTALELSPAEYHNICNRGYSLMGLGKLRDSVECFIASVRRNPLAPSSCLLAASLIDFVQGNYGNAASAAAKITSYPIQRSGMLAASCALAGYDRTAENAVRQFQDATRETPLRPPLSAEEGWTDFWARVYPYMRGESFEMLLRGLAKATLPV